MSIGIISSQIVKSGTTASPTINNFVCYKVGGLNEIRFTVKNNDNSTVLIRVGKSSNLVVGLSQEVPANGTSAQFVLTGYGSTFPFTATVYSDATSIIKNVSTKRSKTQTISFGQAG